MLTTFNRMRGVTLIELMIAVAIFGILIAMGSRSFTSWIQNQQIRTGAESILNGMQLARSEAVKRNANAMFVLCDLAAGGNASSWDVLAASATAVAQACGADAGGATGWERVQQRSGQEGSRNAAVATGGTNAIAFNGFGRVVTLATLPPSANPANLIVQSISLVGVSNQKLGNCESDATPGPARCLSITVGAGGNLRMCDPSPNLAATDSRHC